jgi:hypothetical protein
LDKGKNRELRREREEEKKRKVKLEIHFGGGRNIWTVGDLWAH